jgi:hypothetical protein
MPYSNTARQHFTLDADLILADLVTSTATVAHGQVDGGDATIDIGTGRVNGHFIVDASAMAIDGDDEGYYFELMGIEPGGDEYTLATIELGAAAAFLGSGDADKAMDGRYVAPFSNVVGLDTDGAQVVCGEVYAKMTAAGTTKTVTWFAWLAQNPFP